MATNPYFNLTHYQPEQQLHEDLIIESIKIHGQTFIYIERDEERKDLVYGEDPLSHFHKTHEVEMYIANVDDFEAEGDLFSKFGVEIRDRGRLVVAQSRFCEATDQELIRPREGDLIYFPLTGGMFEIHHVEDESIFYQLGKLHVFTLTVEQFEQSHEKFDTGYEMIDEIAEDKFTYSIVLQLQSGGSGTFIEDERVFQGTDLASSSINAEVHSFDTNTLELRIKNIVGEFQVGDAVTGHQSGATYIVTVADSQDMVQETMDDNVRLESEADSEIFDFTEIDPYSEGDY